MKVINFMGRRRLAALFSVILILVSLGSLATRQLNWGLDFTGGTLVEVHYSESADLNAIRGILDNSGYSGAIVVSFGTDRDVLIRLPKGYSDKEGAELLTTLQQSFAGSVELRRIEFVGPQVGDELREQGGLAMLLALGLVMLYIAFRFQFKFSVCAVVALVHDVIITLGFFSLSGMEFDLTVLAALLAALALFGGEMINGFAIALIVGVAVGTYSSIYVAANTLLLMGVSKEDLMIPVKEGGDQ